ncbi:hypothetical protein BJF86_08895 [Serinicoccus sp. CNJ-927]|uniref:rod shape-determining protein MreC n=1 Tax=Serinicoccus sp. CNJ-927 TaxID=1904970 RepID=UPI0009686705|nr:rod shape-determining protein MreC [Serinicoccus sp. CNJ-927]OLT39143.1 hypothetical protein BJF86_08895 [Serinicoccus sp. CNJ-927]
MRRLTLVSVLLAGATAAAIVVDLARPGLADPVREAVAVAAAPAQRVLAGWDDGELARLSEERNELAAQVDRLEARERDVVELDALARSSTVAAVDRRLLPARVVAFASGSSPVGSRTVTVDVGRENGVAPDQTVVSVDGLVGRVLRVAPAALTCCCSATRRSSSGCASATRARWATSRRAPRPSCPRGATAS